uniref:Uncharacterized protein n=1 Tax=Hucho hucho TaxID=62062 RepID=A0A4W5PP92_9TELE
MNRGVDPIIVDNTNISLWELWPYIHMVRTCVEAKRNGTSSDEDMLVFSPQSPQIQNKF